MCENWGIYEPLNISTLAWNKAIVNSDSTGRRGSWEGKKVGKHSAALFIVKKGRWKCFVRSRCEVTINFFTILEWI